MRVEETRRWAALLLAAAVLASGCATVRPPPGRGAPLYQGARSEFALARAGEVDGEVDGAAAPGVEVSSPAPSRMHRRRGERADGMPMVMAGPAGLLMLGVARNVVLVDSFEKLLALAGLEDMDELPPRGEPLTAEEATRLLTLLLDTPMTLGSFPPRMAVGHMLREVLEEGEVSREELLRRVERFNLVAVLRPDGYVAWTRDGRTQQKAIGELEWRDGAFRAGPLELGRFYVVKGQVFRLADERLRPVKDAEPLAEVYDDADYLSRTLDGAQDAFEAMYHAMGQLLSYPTDSLLALPRLPAGMMALLASSPEYLERVRYMTRGEQVREFSRLATHLLVTWGAAAGTTRALTSAMRGAEVAVPVLSLSAKGALTVERLVLPVGSVGTVLSGGPGAAIVLQQTGATAARTPHRTEPRIEDGNLREGWQHIEARHIVGNHPKGPGDLFAPGTTRQQLERAAKEIIKKGNRISQPDSPMQVFQMRVVVNGRKDLVRVVVDPEGGNRIVTMFPVRGGR